MAANRPAARDLMCLLTTEGARIIFDLSSLESTLIEIPASVDSKPLTQTSSPLDATLTKTTGGGGPVMVNQAPLEACLKHLLLTIYNSPHQVAANSAISRASSTE